MKEAHNIVSLTISNICKLLLHHIKKYMLASYQTLFYLVTHNKLVNYDYNLNRNFLSYQLRNDMGKKMTLINPKTQIVIDHGKHRPRERRRGLALEVGNLRQMVWCR